MHHRSRELHVNPDPNKHTNALIHETSPYLLQHAHNPVNWMPWGDAAFEKARKENKPIFLSVGYSSCHWCHVMEYESFEHEDVAEVLNANFVSIKVDAGVRIIADFMADGRSLAGGWPMSVFMASDGRPFYGATYFPRAQFKELLGKVAAVWKDKNDAVLQDCARLTEALRDHLSSRQIPGQTTLDSGFIESTIDDLYGYFDKQRGGFSLAPKFPPNNGLSYLLYLRQRGRTRI